MSQAQGNFLLMRQGSAPSKVARISEDCGSLSQRAPFPCDPSHLIFRGTFRLLGYVRTVLACRNFLRRLAPSVDGDSSLVLKFRGSAILECVVIAAGRT